MNRLSCEICGGTDLIKQDGVFVCQNCGCKYSVEEVRKMVIEGTVEITGTVKIDQSDNFANLLEAARTSMANGRFASAYQHSVEALAIMPDHPELIAIQSLADFSREIIVSDVPASATNGMKRFYSGFSQWDADFSEKRVSLQNIKR